MPRSPLLARLLRVAHIAGVADRLDIPSSEATERVLDHERRAFRRRLTRRELLAAAGGAAALGAAGRLAPLFAAPPPPPSLDVGIVGAGLAGLACARELFDRRGIAATVYEASGRVGGRCFSLGGAFPGPVTFPGQVAERGGELLDNLHKTMLGWAREFGLTVEDLSKEPGEAFYFFDGAPVPESVVVDEYRDFVPALQEDLRRLSSQPTASSFTPADAELDFTPLDEYLTTRGAGDVIRAVLEVAYTIEYGLEIEQQSALNLLFFVHADRRSKFKPFGVFSDERYHVVEGNQAIAEGLAGRLPRPVRFGHQLLKVARTPAGRIALTFRTGGGSATVAHEAVVLALPFSVLRRVELDTSLGLPPGKVRAIEGLTYGTNAKMMIGFAGRPWTEQGGNGDSYSDLPNHQNTWETNPSRADATRAILTDYSGGERGARLNPNKTQREALAFLTDLDRIYPGALGRARRDAKGRFVAHLEHWPSNPLSLGSYTANPPGYFTTIAGLEATPVGNLHFAGEHTDSFYEWQGFMEGAANSGIRAASEILQALKAGASG